MLLASKPSQIEGFGNAAQKIVNRSHPPPLKTPLFRIDSLFKLSALDLLELNHALPIFTDPDRNLSDCELRNTPPLFSLLHPISPAR